MKMQRWLGLLLSGWLALNGGQVLAASDLTERVEQLLLTHPDLQGRKPRLEWPVRQVALPACDQAPSLGLEPGQKLPGWIQVTAHCRSTARVWERSFQVRVHLWQSYLAASRNLMPGHVLDFDDLVWVEGDSVRLGESLARDPGLVLGRELHRPLTKGSPLRLNNLRPLTVITRGSAVVLILRGSGFEIETQGQAINSAALGEDVKVLVKDGTIIPAKAKATGVAEAQ